MIDTSVRPIPKLGVSGGHWQVAAATAFDGSNYLAVWQDYLDSAGDPNICCARVSPSGTILDPADGIPVGPIAGSQVCPDVAFGDGIYLIVWGDSSGSDYDIHGARLTPSGAVLDSPGFVIASAAGNQNHPVAAFDGVDFLAVWDDTRGGSSDIYGARVTPSGQTLDPNGIAITSDSGQQTLPAVAFGGGCYVVVWQDDRNGNSDIYGSRVSASGQVLDPNGILVSGASNTQELPAIAFDSTNFLIVWDVYRNQSNADIYAARMTPDGQVLDTAGIAVSTASGDQLEPALAFDGSDYLAVWEDNRNPADAHQVVGARVSPGGNVLDPDGFCINDSVVSRPQAAVIAGAEQYLCVWQSEDVYGLSHIWGARATHGGVALDTSAVSVSTEADQQYNPALAFDGTNYLVVWANQIPEVGRSYGDDFTIYGRRVTQSGVPLDTSSFRIAPLSYGFYVPFFPAIAFDGANYLVVWQDGSIHAARVTPSAAVLDSPPILVSAGPTNGSTMPAVAFDGTNYLVVWDDWRNGSVGEIYAARVTPAGQVLDTEGICLSPTPNGQWMAAVAFDRTNYFVVWADFRNGSGNDNPDIYGVRVTPAGVVLDTAGIPVSRVPAWQSEPRVAFDGTNYLVFWDDARPSHPGAYCARVTPAGVVLDTGGIYVANSFVGYGYSGTSVVFDGLHYLAAWTRSGGRDGIVVGAVISPSAVVLDTLAIAEGLFPSIALGSGGQKLLAFNCFTDAAQGKFYRTYRVWGLVNPFGGVTENGPQGPGAAPEISVFPNPAHSCFWVRSSQTLSRLAVHDAAGRLTRSVNCDRTTLSREWRVETQNTAAGVYFVEVKTETKTSRLKLGVIQGTSS